MRDAKVVKKEDLIAIYGSTLNAVNSSNQIQTDNLLNFPSEFLEVEVLATTGPFSLVLASNIRNSQRFMIPANIVQKTKLPYARDSFKEVLDRLMPGRWFDDSSNNGYLYLHYPKLTITNSLGLQHNIEDLVICIEFNNVTGALSSLRGRRYAWTKEELAYTYSHSHLPTDISIFQDFCTGGGSIFNKFLAGMCKTNTAEEFELFIIQLEQYLSWESVEGRPYRWIGELKNPSGAVSNGMGDFGLSSTQWELCDKFARIVVDNLHKFPEMVTINSHGIMWFIPFNSANVDGLHPLMELEQQFIRNNRGSGTSFNRYIETWSWKDKVYKKPIVSAYSQPPTNSTNLPRRVGEIFKLQPRLIEQEETTQAADNQVKRLNIRMWIEVTYRINKILLNASNKTIANGNRNTVTAQTESDNKQGISSPDWLLA